MGKLGDLSPQGSVAVCVIIILSYELQLTITGRSVGRIDLDQCPGYRSDPSAQVAYPRRRKGSVRNTPTPVQASKMAGMLPATLRPYRIILTYAAGHADVRCIEHRWEYDPNHHPSAPGSLDSSSR